MSGNLEAAAAALVAAQADMPTLAKDATAKIKGKTKDGRDFEYEYDYLSLDSLISQVRPVLASHGLTVIQGPQVTDTGHFVLETSIVHQDGGSFTHRSPLPVPPGADAKAWGSWITYFRRYALLSVLFLAPGEDDDGTATQGSGRVDSPSRAAREPQTRPETPDRPDEDPLEPTALQHAKLNAMLAELEEKAESPNGTWLEVCKKEVADRYGKKSRTQLTRVEMTELIDTVQRWGYEEGIPF